jgi:hypothetical protein
VVTLSLLIEAFASTCGLLMPIAAQKQAPATASAATPTVTLVILSFVMIIFMSPNGRASCHLVPMICFAEPKRRLSTATVA